MKIGIITLPPSFNYGNILQAFALQTILGKMGNDAEIVVAEARYPRLSFFRKPFVYAKRIFLKYLKGKKNRLVFEEGARLVMFQHTENFIKRYLKLKNYSSYGRIHSTDYDAFVVGSDQVWRKAYNKRLYDKYLDFAKTWNVRKIAYAASFGVDDWEYTKEDTERCRNLLRKFDAVGVREESGVALVKKYFGMDADWVLDPTLLLTKEDYISYLGISDYAPSEGTLFCYLLTYNSSIEEEVNIFADKEKMIPFHVYANFDNRDLPLEERIQPPLEKWLRAFVDAKLVLTDSFHAVVFSIIFQKPFILLPSSKRGDARMKSLLKMAGFDVFDGFLRKKFIPSEQNKSCLDSYREKSLAFLKKGLS